MLVFDPPADHYVELGLFMVAESGDLNGDGIDDLAWVQRPDGTLEQSVGFALGPALVPVELAVGAYGGITIADLDGDGVDDLVFGTPTEWSVALGGPNGPAEVAWTFTVPQLTRVAAVGDVNGDGSDDLAVGREVWFGGPEGLVEGPAVGPVGDLHPIGDLDGDGIDDLLVAYDSSYGGGHLRAHRGTPDGPEPVEAWSWPQYGRDMRLIELDGDAAPELVMIDSTSAHTYVAGAVVALDGVEGVAPSLMVEGPRYNRQYGVEPNLAAFDPDGDGAPDLAFGWVGVVQQVAVDPTEIQFAGPSWAAGDGAVPGDLLSADLDGNGNADLAVVWSIFGAPGGISVWLSGEPAEPPGTTVPPPEDTGEPPPSEEPDPPEETGEDEPSAPATSGGCGCRTVEPGGWLVLLAACVGRRRFGAVRPKVWR